MSQHRDRVSVGPHTGQSFECLFLIGPQLEHHAVLLGKKVVEFQKPGNSLQEQEKLIFDPIGLLGNLSVGPPKYPPPLMHEAILPEQVFLVLHDAFGVRNMPGQPINFKSDAFIDRPQREVDESAHVKNVLDRVLRRKQANVLDAEDLREQFRKKILRG